jgi:Flp pilus assembly protein TadB
MCIQLMIYEGQLAWRATAVFVPFATALMVASVFPTFTGATDPRILTFTSLFLSLAGLAVAFMWWSMIRRSRRYYRYWIATARELERHLAAVVTIQRGKEIADGNARQVDGETIGLRHLERIRMGANLTVLYAVFLLAFLGLAFLNFVRVIKAF